MREAPIILPVFTTSVPLDFPSEGTFAFNKKTIKQLEMTVRINEHQYFNMNFRVTCNLRVYECKTAAWNVLAYENQPLKEFNKTFLRDIPKESFEACKDRIPARFARRAEHFYSEYRRVRQGVTAWETGNLELFGKLCFASCESSIHNYECGSPELIAIYEIMRSLPGVYGGRFSGAGFKGACIGLVEPSEKENVERELTRLYLEKFPEYEKTFKVYWVKPDDGARFI